MRMLDAVDEEPKQGYYANHAAQPGMGARPESQPARPSALRRCPPAPTGR